MAHKLHQELLDDGVDENDRDTYVLWTGHIMSGSSFGDSEIRSASYSDWRIIVMTPNNVVSKDDYYTTMSDTSNLKYTFTHEMSHQFDTEDHYCDKDSTNDPSATCTTGECYRCDYGGTTAFDNCIMKNSQNADNEDPYCARCKVHIISFISNLEVENEN